VTSAKEDHKHKQIHINNRMVIISFLRFFVKFKKSGSDRFHSIVFGILKVLIVLTFSIEFEFKISCLDWVRIVKFLVFDFNDSVLSF
jgi:hypothetical protein